jgi:hypothetical protein
MCNAVDKALCVHFGATEIYGIRWKIEKSFVHHLGFGGKVDLHSGGLVLDLKTKEFDEKNKPEKYPEQLWQLSAYKYGLGLSDARIANVFVSTSNLGLVHIKEWSQEESKAGWEAFKAIFRAWIHIKKYDPGEILEF